MLAPGGSWRRRTCAGRSRRARAGAGRAGWSSRRRRSRAPACRPLSTGPGPRARGSSGVAQQPTRCVVPVRWESDFDRMEVQTDQNLDIDCSIVFNSARLASALSSSDRPNPERSGAVTSASRLFVRNSTGLVREASALDATIFNAVISAPVGSTLAYSIFFTLVAFPGADVASVLALTVILNIPVLIMFALLAASMPRVGGDYVWVSRILWS